MEEKQGRAVDLRGFAAGTASGITKLVVGKINPLSSLLSLTRGFRLLTARI